MNRFNILGADHLEISVVKWNQVQEPLGVVQISHGMAEHISRYDEFAAFLNEQGFIVYGHDHRGHGESVNSEISYGYLSAENGWHKLVSDIQTVTLKIKEENPNLPIVIFGHSMGSFALRDYLTQYGELVDGAIICGTGNNPKWLNYLALKLAQRELSKKGGKHPSTRMTKLSFGTYNKKFRPNKTDFDWLSRDEIQVYKYIEDELCGKIFTTQFYIDFITGLMAISLQANVNKIPKNIPYLFISGEDDPLAKQGTSIKEVLNQFRSAGAEKVDIRIYPSARHELLNEINRQEIFTDVLIWLKENINKNS